MMDLVKRWSKIYIYIYFFFAAQIYNLMKIKNIQSEVNHFNNFKNESYLLLNLYQNVDFDFNRPKYIFWQKSSSFLELYMNWTK